MTESDRGPLHAEPGAPVPVEAGEAVPGKDPIHHGTIVVKIGGSTLGSHDTTMDDLVALQRGGACPVVVHGGGQVISRWMERQGVRPRFVRGLRVTDQASLEIVVAVLGGVVNKEIVAALNARGGKAVGLSGVDGDILKARQLDPELGLVGRVSAVVTTPIHALLQAGFIPVIAPLAVRVGDDEAAPGSVLNVNADTAAGEIATALGAERLVLLTDVEGVLDTSRRLVPRLTRRQARDLTRSRIVEGGMVPKLEACVTALGSVRSTHIVDGRKPRALMDVLAGRSVGTRVG